MKRTIILGLLVAVLVGVLFNTLLIRKHSSIQQPECNDLLVLFYSYDSEYEDSVVVVEEIWYLKKSVPVVTGNFISVEERNRFYTNLLESDAENFLCDSLPNPVRVSYHKAKQFQLQ